MTQSVIALSGGEIVARLVGFVATAYIARTLGPDMFGILGFALAVAGLVSLGVTGGLASIGAREVAAQPSNAGTLAASVVAIRVPFAIGLAGLLALGLWAVPRPELTKTVTMLATLSFFTLALDTSWVQQGLERTRSVGLALVLAQGVYLSAVLLWVSSPPDVVWIPPAIALGEAMAAGFLAVLVFRGRRSRIDFRLGARLWWESRALFVTRGMRAALTTFDVVLLAFLTNDILVGLYVAAYRICFVMIALSDALFFAYLPDFTRARSQGPDALSEVATRSASFSAAIGVPVAVGGAFVAEPLLVALFGPAYADAAVAFSILLASCAVMLLANPLRNIALVHDRLGAEMRIMVLATVANIALNLLLIPRFGLIGAAAATLAAEIGVFAALSGVVRKLGVRTHLQPLLGVGGAGAVLAAFLGVAGSSLPLALTIGAGATVYIAALFMLRAVPADALVYVRELGARFH